MKTKANIKGNIIEVHIDGKVVACTTGSFTPNADQEIKATCETSSSEMKLEFVGVQPWVKEAFERANRQYIQLMYQYERVKRLPRKQKKAFKNYINHLLAFLKAYGQPVL